MMHVAGAGGEFQYETVCTYLMTSDTSDTVSDTSDTSDTMVEWVANDRLWCCAGSRYLEVGTSTCMSHGMSTPP